MTGRFDKTAIAAQLAAARKDAAGEGCVLVRPDDRRAAVTRLERGDVDLGRGIDRHRLRRGDIGQRAEAADEGLIERIGRIAIAALERPADAHQPAAGGTRGIDQRAGETNVGAVKIDAAAFSGAPFGRDLAPDCEIAGARHRDLAA